MITALTFLKGCGCVIAAALTILIVCLVVISIKAAIDSVNTPSEKKDKEE